MIILFPEQKRKNFRNRKAPIRTADIINIRLKSANQWFEILTFVPPNWQKHAIKPKFLKRRQNIAQLKNIWAN